MPPAQLLSASQERALWEEVLRELAGDGPSLDAHANGLIRAAGRATESLLKLSQSALSAEEQLLVLAITQVRQRCAARGLFSLRLAPPEALTFLQAVPPPGFVGGQRLTPLQEAIRRQCWGEAQLLLTEPVRRKAAPELRCYPSLDAELAACAQWCLARLHDDGASRLLVLSACSDPSLAIQGELLWRHLAGTGRDSLALRNQMLAVEGGAPLLDIGLIAAALLALECLAPDIDTEQLYALLRSPHFQFGSELEMWQLQGWLEKWARARWSVDALIEALASVTERAPAAARLAAWLQSLRGKQGRSPERQPASDWARRFNDALAAAGFNRRPGVDSSEQQRLDRWGELLDEYSSLDAVLPTLNAMEALERLRGLAAAGRHQVASGDAAITFSSALGDPVIDYDGIWVLGLTESRWPAPPRPDAYVSLAEQRAHHWPEASVAERRAQALWALSRWQRRTGELILTYPELEGELRHRPTALPGEPAANWTRHRPTPAPDLPELALAGEDQQFPPLQADGPAPLLRGGMERLRIQNQCPFRAQAQWRLEARAPGPLSDGLTAAQRGTLLHALLQRLWEALRDQGQLLALTPQAEHALLDRHWHALIAGGAVAGSRWWPARLVERERVRTLKLLADVLQLERSRAPFAVVERELSLQWPATGAHLELRIDRVDRVADARLLIDYKSGGAERIRLQEGQLEPLQLALYITALATQGAPVTGAALLSLKPETPEFSGVAARDSDAIAGLKPVEAWDEMAAAWQQQLHELISNHLAGAGTLARDHGACRFCHLPALCRRAAVEDLEDQEDADE